VLKNFSDLQIALCTKLSDFSKNVSYCFVSVDCRSRWDFWNNDYPYIFQWLLVFLSSTLSYMPIKPLRFKNHDTVIKHGVVCTLYVSTLKRRSCLWISLTFKKLIIIFQKIQDIKTAVKWKEGADIECCYICAVIIWTLSKCHLDMRINTAMKKHTFEVILFPP
jgi:hypothetical protein